MNAPHLLLVPLLLAGLGCVALWVGAVVSVLRTAPALRAALWVVATLALPVLGPVAWFLLGRPYERDLALERTDDVHETHAGLLAR